MLEDRTILITGATGQVARPIVEALNLNNEVWAAARFSDQKAKEELQAQGINTVHFTMGESDLSHLPDVDYVIHCGCNVDPKTADIGMADNAEGTGFLMQRYKNAKAFFHMSSSSVYSMTGDSGEPVSETSRLGGFASYSVHYAMSKQSSEAVVRFLARSLNLPTVIARLDVAYGTCGHGGAPMALVEMMKYSFPYTRAERGESFCTPIHQDDIIEQVQGLIKHASVPALIVNLGGDESVSVEQMIAYLESITGLSMKIETGAMASWQMTVLDNEKRKSLVGPCSMTWQEGIREVLEARSPEMLAR